MAVAYKAVGTGVANANNVVNPSTLTTGAMPTHVAGDFLLLYTTCRSITATVATPSGWTIFPGFPVRSATASGGSIYCFYKYAASSSETAPAPVWTGVATGTSGDSASAIVFSFSGVHATTPSDATVPAPTDASAANPSIPSITTATAGATVVGLSMKVSDTAQTATIANSFTERNDGHTTSGTGHHRYMATRDMASPGATGASTVTQSNGTAARCLAVPLALKSAPAPTATPVARVSLGTVALPINRQGHSIGMRARKASGSGTVLLKGAIYEGASNRSGDLTLGTLTTSLAAYSGAISEASASTITDYSNLELRIWGTSATGDAVSVEVSEAWLETPEAATNYQLAVLNEGILIAYWRLDETAGTVALNCDGVGLDGTYQGSPTLGSSGLLQIEGADGRSVSLDGTDDAIQIADAAALDVINGVTVEFWVDVATLAADKTLVQKSGAWSVWVAGTNLRFEVDGVVSVETPVRNATGRKLHVVCTYDRVAAAMYLNGGQVAVTNATAAITATTGNLRIGADLGGAPLFLQAKMSDVAIYSAALPAANVKAHYRAAVPATGITVRDFDGVDDRIYMALGDCDTGSTSPYSLGALVRFDSFASYPIVVALGHGSAMGAYLAVDTTGKLSVGNGAADSFVPAGNELVPGEWYFVGADNGAGTGLPRLHQCRLSTATWQHFDGDISLAHDSVTKDRVIFGVWINDLSSQLDGQLSVAGVWKRRLSDSEWATLEDGSTSQAWSTLSPNGLWNFDQASVATSVLDLSTVGTADQNAINGTAVDTDGPPAWNYTVGPPPLTQSLADTPSITDLATPVPKAIPREIIMPTMIPGY